MRTPLPAEQPQLGENHWYLSAFRMEKRRQIMVPEVFTVMIPAGRIVRGDRLAAGEGGIVESRHQGAGSRVTVNICYKGVELTAAKNVLESGGVLSPA